MMRPDRSLDLDLAAIGSVVVRTPGLPPFVYRKMVQGPEPGRPPARGEIVRINDAGGSVLGYGLWNPRSQIAVRTLTRGDRPPSSEFWSARIEDAVRLRTECLGLDAVTNAYRVVHAEADGLSGLIADRLGEVLSIECFSLGIYRRARALAELLRKRMGLAHYRVRVDERVQLQEDFTAEPLVSPDAPGSITIQEHGIRYRIRFDAAHKTGFFCDQRDNRDRLAAYCAGRAVLDVCCYTGGFHLNALIRGRAREVTGVDLDEQALALARENAHLNQVRTHLVHADGFGYLRQMDANGRRYGVVVLDPPKLATHRDELGAAKKKYYDLNALALRVVEPGGLLLTCSCSGLIGADEFRGVVRAAARAVGRPVRLIAETGAAPDHPVSLEIPETAYLKALWLIVGESETGQA
ncbi:MAG: oxidoreductase [Isosphaeraceae bacterium]|nr:MAG: oxidoreductase [Isosphaeraceae bacterium]